MKKEYPIKMKIPSVYFDDYYTVVPINYCYSVDNAGQKEYYTIIHIDEKYTTIVPFRWSQLNEKEMKIN